ncbi:MAG: choline dehydrogenase [Verrucomicrobiaceae bacterium]|nr:choline dehydrogenase [Verrucomicrobiaceae bacterium]
METFDYVIVGGGTAASIIAYRLGEQGHSVCVLEAGPPDSNPYIRVPAGFMKTLFDPKLTWQYQYEPSPQTNNRLIQVTQGKTLGGSSSVNGMVYNRGQAADYDTWAALGNPGWSYQEVLPCFRRTERRIGPGDDNYRGRDGLLTTTTQPWPNPLVDAFVAAAQQRGYPLNPDHNGATQEGVGFYQSAIYRGRRVSTASAFLHPARRHYQVDIRTNALATQIVLDKGRATGVKYLRGESSDVTTVNARKEVIVAAGTINSPKLLQLSGIGPSALLQQHGVSVAHALAGVGLNFRDHFSPRLVARVKDGIDSINAHVKGLPLLLQIAKWALGQPSILSLSPALAHVFGKTDPNLPYPNFSLVFTPASYKQGFIGVIDDAPGLTCGVWQMRPESSGHVRISSGDPRAKPIANPNYLGEEADRLLLVAALKKAREVLQAPALAGLLQQEILPGSSVNSDDEWLGFARQYGMSSYHLVGSCKMGPASDPLAVVDAQLRVHGIAGLRVADASIMPTMPSGNTYAPTMMIAEKAAELILQG